MAGRDSSLAGRFENMTGKQYARLGNALVSCLEEAIAEGMPPGEALSVMAGVVSDFAHLAMPVGFKERLAEIVTTGGPLQARERRTVQ